MKHYEKPSMEIIKVKCVSMIAGSTNESYENGDTSNWFNQNNDQQ